jgi:hypothetical protein
MFSSLGNYPAHSFKLKNIAVNAEIGQDRRVAPGPSHVAGGDRYKYFKRPVMPYGAAVGAQIVYHKRAAETVKIQQERPLSPFKKTVMTQTIYRYLFLTQ